MIDKSPNNNNNSSSNLYKFEFDYIKSSKQLSLIIIKKNQINEKRLDFKPFKIQLKLEIPNRLKLDEIVYRLCSYKQEEDQQQQQQQQTTRPTSPSSTSISSLTLLSIDQNTNLFDYLIKFDETFLNEFKFNLNKFIQKQNQLYYDDLCRIALNKLNNSTSNGTTSTTTSITNSINGSVGDTQKLNDQKEKLIDKEQISSYWSKVIRNNHVNFFNTVGTELMSPTLAMSPLSQSATKSNNSATHLFAKMYHTLIHSELMLNVLQREKQYASDLNDLINERDKSMRFILETTANSADSNSSIHLEMAKWSGRINYLKNIQQRKFRNYVKKLYEHRESNDTSSGQLASINGSQGTGAATTPTNSLVNFDLDDDFDDQDETFSTRNENSFDNLLKSSSSVDLQSSTNNKTENLKNLKQQLNRVNSNASNLSGATVGGGGGGIYRSISGLNTKRLEESYTIQLGAQLKSTHNLRLIRTSVYEFCRDRFNRSVNGSTGGGGVSNSNMLDIQIEPQTIQTAMSTYSDKLCALVLLVDTNFNNLPKSSSSAASTSASTSESSFGFDSIDQSDWRYLADICDRNGCEFHFLPIEQQTELASKYSELNRTKTRKLSNKNEKQQSSSSSPSTPMPTENETKTNQMNLGDFYVTKHSNLSQVHVVFHLAASESTNNNNDTNQIHSNPSTTSLSSLSSSSAQLASSGGGSSSSSSNLDSTKSQTLKQSDLSSRHPVILGLRNILKICISNNIQTLTFPLLLTHEMTEDMTISWVMKRAELVLKCIKGFMIEFVQWGAQESRTLQFVVPQGLLDETFNSLSNLIPTIFRESRTVNLV